MGKEKKDTSLYSKDTVFSHSQPEFDLYTGNFQAIQLLTKLNEAKISIKDEGTISADDLEKELGL